MREVVQQSDWRDGFLFVGNHLTLDFLNTSPVQDGEVTELLPNFNDLLRWFRTVGLLEAREAASLARHWGETPEGRRALDAARSLREKLRKQVLGWERGEAIHHSLVAELNRLMAAHPMLTRMKEDGPVALTEVWFKAHAPQDLLGPLAYSAVTFFADVDRNRVRECGQCVLHFLDTSKKGTRRWCSMQLCGNRKKVAAYAARQRLKDRG
jgi:predicted RNA-binding Zn ribbon-like protein